jgi:hypothetical protein
MPLRNHFRSPSNDPWEWEGFYGGWPAMMVLELNRQLPPDYYSAPHIQLAGSTEVDVPWLEGGSESVAVPWSPPPPTFSGAGLPVEAEYEVRVYRSDGGQQLVGAVEFVAPPNKDRPERRRAFVARCLALLQQRVSVVIVDIVTSQRFNLFDELLRRTELQFPATIAEQVPIYATACRAFRKDRSWRLESWLTDVKLGQPLPTLPLWIAENCAIPLDLEATYEETCRVLRIE